MTLMIDLQIIQNLSQWTGEPSALNSADLRLAAAVIAEGGAIRGTIEQITARLANAHWLTVLRDERSDQIVGVAALKNPNSQYRRDTFSHAKVSLDGYENAKELGYVVVAADWQGKGLAERLIERIISEIRQPVYATTDNPKMIGKLHRAGLRQVGSAWRGQRGRLSLWVGLPRN